VQAIADDGGAGRKRMLLKQEKPHKGAAFLHFES
jgi:hypothetical protein